MPPDSPLTAEVSNAKSGEVVSDGISMPEQTGSGFQSQAVVLIAMEE
jgi:hypothetical protein